MEDIAVKLLEKVEETFQEGYDESKVVPDILEKVASKTAAYGDADEFSVEVGKILSSALQENLSGSMLPDGILDHNTAEKLLTATMGNNYDIISDVALQVQQSLNESAGIGIKAIQADLDTDRLYGLINKISDKPYDDISWCLGDPIVNFSQSIVDNTVKANVEFQGGAGLKPKVIRKLSGEACKWCRALAGAYDYPDVPKDVYRRHENCRCTVEYNPGNGKRQDVWSKKWTSPEENVKIETRKQIGLKETSQDIQAIRKSVGLQETGAEKGALTSKNDPDFKKREEHAKKYYESIRHSKKSYIVDSISQNTGVDSSIVDTAIEHLFYSKHDLGKGYAYFDSDYDIAESIRRLREGKEIQPHDLVLLQHEALEASIMSTTGATYDEAHALTNLEYNYKAGLLEFLKENGLE